MSDSGEVGTLRNGGESAFAELFSLYRDRLERMVEFRLDARLRGRIDPSDVLQEAYLRSAQRLEHYLANPVVSFYVWLRSQTFQTLIDLHRQQSAQKRDAAAEIRLGSQINPEETGASIAQALFKERTSPSQAAVRAEEIRQLREALATMDEIDREVLALRHFEHLSNSEVAEALELSPTAASNRYVRAMTRLGEIMTRLAANDA